MQKAINMHSSQVSHGIVDPTIFVDVGPNPVVTGYTPSMVRIILTDSGMDPLGILFWYSTMPDHMFAGSAMIDSFIEVTENGFILEGAPAVIHEMNTAGFIWEVFGCENDGSYNDPMHPDAVDASTAMPFIGSTQLTVPGYIPPSSSLSSETDIMTESQAVVTDIDNTGLTLTVVAATSADGLMGELQAVDGSNQSYNITEADEVTAVEGATVLTTGDLLTVYAEDEEAYATYAITVSA